MEAVASPGRVEPMQRVVGIVTDILYVTQQVSLGILGHGLSDVRADPPESDRDLLDRATLDRKPPEEHEAPTSEELLADALERRAERREREVGARDIRDVEARALDRIDGTVDLVHLHFAHLTHPLEGITQVGSVPDVRATR